MRVYVDNNILSSIIGNEFSEETGEAMEKIALSDLEFITSKVTREEMEKSRKKNIKGASLFIYRIFGSEKFFNKETYFATGWGDAPFGVVPFGGGEVENPALSILKQIFDPDDARHIFQALSNKSDFFLTLDERSILKRYRRNYKNIIDFCNNGNLKIVNPIELTKELNL